jgi:IS5 family transposase
MPSAVLAEVFPTKLHASPTRKAAPIYIAITPGQRHEMMKADELLANAPGKAYIADAGYDSNRFRQPSETRRSGPSLAPSPSDRASCRSLARCTASAISSSTFFTI